MITKFHILFSDEVFNVKSNWDKTHLFSLVNDFEDLEWNYTRFINFIFNNLMYTALSEEEREKMINQDSTRLQQACRKLRFTDSKDKGEGSEIAEIFLYGIMNEYYHALPVVPKIFYKQNSQDPVKGADSVHIVINDNDFSLWLGEAKFYKSIEDSRLDRIVESVIDSLNTNKIKKENSIITNLQDIKKLIKDEVLLKQILLALEHDSSIDYIKTKIHIPIFLLHECKITQETNRLSDEYKKSIIEFHKQRCTVYFEKLFEKIGGISLWESITFHLLLFPIPDKQELIKKFTKKAQIYRE